MKLAVFLGEEYYAAGGAADLVGFASSIDEAWSMVDAMNPDHERVWCHAIDLETKEVFKREGWNALGYGCNANTLTNWYD